MVPFFILDLGEGGWVFAVKFHCVQDCSLDPPQTSGNFVHYLPPRDHYQRLTQFRFNRFFKTVLPRDAIDGLVTSTNSTLELESWSTRDCSNVKEISVFQRRENILNLKTVQCFVGQLLVYSFVGQAIRKRKRHFVKWRQQTNTLVDMQPIAQAWVGCLGYRSNGKYHVIEFIESLNIHHGFLARRQLQDQAEEEKKDSYNLRAWQAFEREGEGELEFGCEIARLSRFSLTRNPLPLFFQTSGQDSDATTGIPIKWRLRK